MLRKKYKQISKLSIKVILFFVPKKVGKELMIDSQKLNEVTEKNPILLTKMNNTLNQLIKS